MATHTIDPERCTRCGSCADICPARVFERTDECVTVSQSHAGLCLRCGHCMAICPAQAVNVEGMDYAEFADMPPRPEPNAVEALFRRRRSIRAFKDEPVPRETLQRIVDAAAAAPMGFPPSQVEVTALASRSEVAVVAAAAVQQCKELDKLLGSVWSRLMLRLSVDKKTFRLMVTHLQPLLAPAVEVYESQGMDVLTWGAPALLLFHIDALSGEGETDCAIAATHAMLMAEALGVGGIMLGNGSEAVEHSKELKQRFGIPLSNRVYHGLALGYAKHKFRRTIPRQFKSVTWRAGTGC